MGFGILRLQCGINHPYIVGDCRHRNNIQIDSWGTSLEKGHLNDEEI
jgi:hypothetical protein